VIAAHAALQRPPDAKLLVLAADGTMAHAPRSALADYLRPGDVLVANDAATLPGSLGGVLASTGASIEVRLAGRWSLRPDDMHWLAIVFGEGDFRTRTEDRPPPPPLARGHRLVLGPLVAKVDSVLGHPRLIGLEFEGPTAEVWAGIARHGRPIQYAHVDVPLALWDVWTSIAGPPVAFEAPSAGFALDWQLLAALRLRGIAFVTLTHAAGISSTGDPLLDAKLPFDEAYTIPEATVRAIRCTRARGGRVIAVGTTVVRALEHATAGNVGLRPGPGLATQRIGPRTRLRIVDAILSGTHEPGTSHYELLRAFADDASLRGAGSELDAHGYRTHEFGDSVLIERRNASSVQGMSRHVLAA
jgi:S-adenosylmethionine:tRNA ribosyltransferase-isomerase